VREELKIDLVGDVNEALKLALEPAPSRPVPLQV